MFVVGTAGHVDHGKTALIRALTGIDPDRLPEEKARGMTTDLGFAYFEGPGSECVGVVDVPGHERFLRNMAAGAWGLDLALLVVAADDGWMAQSRTHARILASLSAPDVLLVVTKIDAVGPGRAEEVGRDAAIKAEALFGFRPEARFVSARTGEGVPELKAAILARLFPDRRVFAGTPYLYVDRVFSLTGAGTVATGTLRGGPLSVKDELVLWPAGEKVRVRSLQTYKAGTELALPVSRTALALPKPRSELRRGNLLAAAGMEVLSGREFLCLLAPLPGEAELCPRDEKGRPLLRPGLEAELVLGSAHRDATVSPYRTPGWLRVVCAEPLACPPGQPFALLRRGGTELLARGRVISEGTTDIRTRRALDAVLPEVPALASALQTALGPGRTGTPEALEGNRAGPAAAGPARQGYAGENAAALPVRRALEILSRGWTGFGSEEVQSEGLSGLRGIRAVKGASGMFVFSEESYSRFRSRLVETAGKPGGAVKAELESASGLGSDACSALLADLETEKTLDRAGPRWIRPGPGPKLGKEEARLEALLIRADAEGVEPGRNVPGQDGRTLKTLCALGRAVSLDTGVFWHLSVYERLSEAVLSGRAAGERFSVGQAKDRTGLSRKYILPLLNRMEDEDLVKREGDVRVVLPKGARD